MDRAFLETIFQSKTLSYLQTGYFSVESVGLSFLLFCIPIVQRYVKQEFIKVNSLCVK